jgi:CDP-4-dehydro-6-deoxyglucose reductase
MGLIEVSFGGEVIQFESNPRASLLDQMLSNLVPVNYSCKRGDCGQCEVRLVEGQVAPVSGKQVFLHGGGILSCSAFPRTNLSIEVPYDPELEGISILRSPAKINELNRLSEDVIEVVFRLPPNQEIVFLPGQYIRVTNGEGAVRSYSLAAGASSDRTLRVHIRKVVGGQFSRWLFERAAVNDLLFIEGPQGRFFLRENIKSDKSIFLATGTGIAPIWAILSAASEEQLHGLGEVYVYWGNREHSGAYLAQELEQLASEKGYYFRAVFSSVDNGGTDEKRYVQHQMLADHPDLSRAQVFACGSAAMIEGARDVAISAGLPGELFHSDPFTAS